MEEIEAEFSSADTASISARNFLRGTLETWALDGFGEITELLTSELVSNVVRHVGAPMTVRALRHPSRIRVEVDDTSREPPLLKHPTPLESHGRGILLVDALADAWGTILGDHGKTVWFEIDITPGTHEMHSG